ncbi:MAG: DNA protecting protein DprA [Actinobacteria bacterium RBG_16_64_13]|nr:MAG: DNA protecting protein DprA [Actinobacteria bacterium RBG_16_64_13]
MEEIQGGQKAYEAALGLAWLTQTGCHSLLGPLRREGPERVWRATPRCLLAWGVSRLAVDRFEEKRRGFCTADARASLAGAGLRFVPYGSRLYPVELAHLPLPPAGLFARGDDEALERLACMPRVTIVGTRRATAYGLRVTEALATAFAGKGIAVVSGMALGVDACAHDSAMKAGGLTVAVLGCGADIVYPPRNRGLYEKAATIGMVLSELPPGTAPARWTFPHRNRLLAALGDAVLVTEASSTSGALQTASWALELGRPVFAVPGSIYVEGHKGCNLLLRDGAAPVIDPCATVEDFLLQTRIERGDRQMCAGRRGAPCGGGIRNETTRDRERRGGLVLEALASGPLSVDGLCRRTGLPPRELSATLAELELAGLATRAGPGMYIRAP